MAKTYLMVGGDHAGQRISLEHEIDCIDVPKYRDESAMWNDQIEEPRIIPRSEAFDTYRRELLYDRKDYIVVYCLEGVNLIGELLQGYHPVVKKV